MQADVWRQHHDELAGFMAAMAPDGAAQAVNLTGLTLKGEMDMALRIGQYRCVPLYSLHLVELSWHLSEVCALAFIACTSWYLIAMQACGSNITANGMHNICIAKNLLCWLSDQALSPRAHTKGQADAALKTVCVLFCTQNPGLFCMQAGIELLGSSSAGCRGPSHPERVSSLA